MLAGLANCARQPDEEIIPYVKQPEDLIPGRPQYFATAATLSGIGIGLIATAHENRPTKLEGLPAHPSSLGRADIWSQAALLDMYDPDRLDTVKYEGQISTLESLAATLARARASLEASGGAGLRVLTETVTSPTLARQLEALLQRFPEARWVQYEPANRDNAHEGAIAAFGQPVETTYAFDRARVVLSLDADFLATGPGRVRYAHDYARAREVEGRAHSDVLRLYVAESSPTLTGSNADHRASVGYAQVETLARVIARRLGAGAAEVPLDAAAAEALSAGWVDAVVRDLETNRGASIVIAGEEQPPAVHTLAHLINQLLGNPGKTVQHREPVAARPENQTAALARLEAEMAEGRVEALIILGGNPAYTAPADLEFAAALAAMKGRLCVHLTSHENETSALCAWSVPEAHFLEAWSDVRAHDGTVTIVQPIIHPLYPQAHSAHELIALFLGEGPSRGYDIVRATWQARWGADFDRNWKRTLMAGLIPGTESPAAPVAVRRQLPAHTPPAREGLDVVFRTDPAIFDGRFVNNGWLMELPRPLTKITWDNAVFMSRKTAAGLGVKTEDVVTVSLGGRSVDGTVFVQPGHPDGSVTLHLGYGRARTGRVGEGAGFNAYALRTSGAPWHAAGATVTPTGATSLLARTEDHYLIEQSAAAGRRHLIREAPLAHFASHPDFAQHMGHHEPGEQDTLYDPEEKKFGGYQWGMTIDLNRCTGCSACVVACQSENNIPVVGKQEIARGREMLWIRVDRYYRADSEEGLDQPEMAFQPIPCMQCENAPCEPVCPVGATMHSKEGLNDMVYNRCVGTRYCSNNCPYKVRRFNFFKYADHTTPQLKLMRNPNVTVRARGVMEKCTYCVQRINTARILAKKEGREIRDGEVVTACQSACPAGAITFGNINDPDSAVSAKKRSPRNYGLLADIGTRPRTTYLAKVRNPSPALAESAGSGDGHH
jgi:molybdopterin-containing oxidoreductase family iron-sulfur binding subunit